MSKSDVVNIECPDCMGHFLVLEGEVLPEHDCRGIQQRRDERKKPFNGLSHYAISYLETSKEEADNLFEGKDSKLKFEIDKGSTFVLNPDNGRRWVL